MQLWTCVSTTVHLYTQNQHAGSSTYFMSRVRRFSTKALDVLGHHVFGGNDGTLTVLLTLINCTWFHTPRQCGEIHISNQQHCIFLIALD